MPKKKRPELKDHLYERLAHGDEAHREWLRNEIDLFFSERSLTEVTIPRVVYEKIYSDSRLYEELKAKGRLWSK